MQWNERDYVGMSDRKIILSMGTRPEIIKMAPLYHELKAAGAKPLLLHTGQHEEMAMPLYEFFAMKPDFTIHLNRRMPLKSRDKISDLSDLGVLLFRNISPIFAEINPSIVAVHGDTLSALIAALCAFYNKSDIAHIEAGLRSHERYQPFPEEKNREIIARLARWHFAPTPIAAKNLMAEGIKRSNIFTVGNTGVDAAKLAVKYLEKLKDPQIDTLLPEKLKSLLQLAPDEKIILVTAHRRENLMNIAAIAGAVRGLMERQPKFRVVWPVHLNPKVLSVVERVFADVSGDVGRRLHITKPLKYPVLLWALSRSWLVLTDSGGIQEEAVSLHIPVYVLRDNTERPEIIRVGAGKIIGTDKNVIIQQVTDLYNKPHKHEKMCRAKNPFGDGKAAQKITSVLVKYLNT